VRAALLLLSLITVACQRLGVDDWAAQVASMHGQVDTLLDRGARDEARDVLRSIVDSAPGDHPHRRPLLQDTYFRLARLALANGDAATAQREAEAGLALGDHGDLFTANLLVVRGTAREALGAGTSAITDYERALAINETLLQEAAPAP
jgi:hypothetical protein